MADQADVRQRLRGHHLLCALGFRGYGYSQAFAENMAGILGRLAAAPDTPVTLVDRPDDICAAFPADRPAHCLEPEVLQRDRRVIAALGLHPGEGGTWAELLERAARTFVPADLDRLCATCPWLPLGYCRQGLAAHSASLIRGPGRSRP